ncbi:MAG: hypothetical protein HY054_00360 [Proteobacteria bacterium]|nr:hypothetical protein [Pseudomonadota bacterium]
MSNKEWPLWEVFVRGKGGLSHRHVGSVHAAPGEAAALFEPAEDKVYRHPTFYTIPANVKHI